MMYNTDAFYRYAVKEGEKPRDEAMRSENIVGIK